jgi:peroxiredoxin
MKWLDRIFGGPKDMAALPAGTTAPEFSLPALGGGNFSLQEALRKGPVLAAFFKVSCPVCQYTFPFLERIYKAHGDEKVSIVGVSQNNEKDTQSFLAEHGVTFRTLIEDPKSYAASNAYGLTNVPSLFLIGQDGQVEVSSVGWVKKDIEEINRKLSAGQQTSPVAIFRAGEEVRDFRAG